MAKAFKVSPIAIQFKENPEGQVESGVKAPDKIQLMKTGSFSYWEPADMVITKETFISMVKNFKAGVRGVDLAVDYSHAAHLEAAGWIKDVYTDESGEQLWAEIDWTPAGGKSLEEKEYRYVSAEFCYDYVDEGGAHHGPCLFGAGLTNRSFLKQMEPLVELHESSKEKRMTLEEQIKALAESVTKLSEKVDSLTKDKDEEKTVQESNKQEPKDEQKKVAFDSMLKEGKVVEAQREAFMQGDIQKFTELSQVVKFDNIGQSGATTNVEKKSVEKFSAEEAEDEILRLSQEIMKEKKVTYREALAVVFEENPVLKEKYESKF